MASIFRITSAARFDSKTAKGHARRVTEQAFITIVAPSQQASRRADCAFPLRSGAFDVLAASIPVNTASGNYEHLHAHDRLEDNLNPVGRVVLLGVHDDLHGASLSQEGRSALGAQAGEALLREVVRGWLYALQAHNADAVQSGFSGAGLNGGANSGPPR
jgi:hypothetical protein